MSITDVPSNSKMMREARDNPEARTIHHVTVYVHPDFQDFYDDAVLLERFMATRGYWISSVGDGTLTIDDELTGVRKVIPAGLWGEIDFEEQVVVPADGASFDEDNFRDMLFELNAVLAEQAGARRDIAREINAIPDLPDWLTNPDSKAS